MFEFCLVVEVHQGGSAANRATLPSFKKILLRVDRITQIYWGFKLYYWLKNIRKNCNVSRLIAIWWILISGRVL